MLILADSISSRKREILKEALFDLRSKYTDLCQTVASKSPEHDNYMDHLVYIEQLYRDIDRNVVS